MDKVGVTVVDHVKHVRAIAPRRKPARVIEVTVGEPIEDARPRMIRETRDAREPAAHPWAKTNKLDAVGPSCQLIEQPLGHEVHARPSLFDQVADNADTERAHRRVATNHAWLLMCGGSQPMGDPSVSRSANRRPISSRNAIQLKPL